MVWTKQKLAALSPRDRENLWKNARRRTTPAATALVKMIEDSGLPYSEAKCPTLDDPLAIAIYDVVFSREGRAAAVNAVEGGLPPLAGIDPLLSEKLGVDYGAHNMTTATAGGFIAQLMRSLGYKEVGKNAPLPAGSVAKTGQVWSKKSNRR
jgi:hypothetical protein